MSRNRPVDIGREESLVPWSEWFQRAAAAMDRMLDGGDGDGADAAEAGPRRRIFRVVLRSGRVYAAVHVITHVARGKCMLPGDRFVEVDPSPTPGLCDVITGYTLVGSGPDGLPTVLNVPPAEIASVECVAAPTARPNGRAGEQSEEPFGFASFAHRREALEVEEEEEGALFASVSGSAGGDAAGKSV